MARGYRARLIVKGSPACTPAGEIDAERGSNSRKPRRCDKSGRNPANAHAAMFEAGIGVMRTKRGPGCGYVDNVVVMPS